MECEDKKSPYPSPPFPKDGERILSDNATPEEVQNKLAELTQAYLESRNNERN